MYTDKKPKTWVLISLCCLLVLILGALCWRVFTVSRADLQEEATHAMRDAIRQSAMQCYVVEGVYPPTLHHLEENYGLQVNRQDYYVVYEAFASNLPPVVTVVPRG